MLTNLATENWNPKINSQEFLTFYIISLSYKKFSSHENLPRVSQKLILPGSMKYNRNKLFQSQKKTGQKKQAHVALVN